MLFFSLTARSTGDRSLATLSAWVNNSDTGQAREMLRARLYQRGWEICTINEMTTTDEDDYFAPCPSLDAYRLAQHEGVALRFFTPD